MSSYAAVADPHYYYLKDFQSRRLADTYADFTAKPEYEAACTFFFNHLYSVADTSDRDAAFRKVHRNVKRFLGGEVVASMTKLIELQELTLELDQGVLVALRELDAPRAFDMATYDQAYRDCGRYDDRVRQIELLAFTNRLIHRISHRFGIGMVLKGLRAACLVVGETRLVDFLGAGYRAFADLKDIEPLAVAIGAREKERLDRIFHALSDRTRAASFRMLRRTDK